MEVINVTDEIIDGSPKYNITDNGDGTNDIELANTITQSGTPINKALFDKINNNFEETGLVAKYNIPTLTQLPDLDDMSIINKLTYSGGTIINPTDGLNYQQIVEIPNSNKILVIYSFGGSNWRYVVQHFDNTTYTKDYEDTLSGISITCLKKIIFINDNTFLLFYSYSSTIYCAQFRLNVDNTVTLNFNTQVPNCYDRFISWYYQEIVIYDENKFMIISDSSTGNSLQYARFFNYNPINNIFTEIANYNLNYNSMLQKRYLTEVIDTQNMLSVEVAVEGGSRYIRLYKYNITGSTITKTDISSVTSQIYSGYGDVHFNYIGDNKCIISYVPYELSQLKIILVDIINNTILDTEIISDIALLNIKISRTHIKDGKIYIFTGNTNTTTFYLYKISVENDLIVLDTPTAISLTALSLSYNGIGIYDYSFSGYNLIMLTNLDYNYSLTPNPYNVLSLSNNLSSYTTNQRVLIDIPNVFDNTKTTYLNINSLGNKLINDIMEASSKCELIYNGTSFDVQIPKEVLLMSADNTPVRYSDRDKIIDISSILTLGFKKYRIEYWATNDYVQYNYMYFRINVTNSTCQQLNYKATTVSTASTNISTANYIAFLNGLKNYKTVAIIDMSDNLKTIQVENNTGLQNFNIGTLNKLEMGFVGNSSYSSEITDYSYRIYGINE